MNKHLAAAWQRARQSSVLRSRKVIMAAAVVALLVIALLALPALIDINSYRGQIGGQLEQRLGRSITLGALSLRVLPSVKVSVTDAVIGDDPQFAPGAFVKAQSVRLQIGLWSLLTGEPEVRGIELTGPEIALIKEKRGAWNWSTLRTLQSSEASAEFPPLDILIRHGRFTLTDRSQTPPAERAYTDIDLAVADFSARTASDFTLAITMPGERRGQLRIEGAIGPIARQDLARTPLDARVRMEQVDLSGLEALLDHSAPRAARLTLDAQVTGSLAESLAARGQIKAEHLKLTVDGAPASLPLEADFDLTITPEEKADYAVKIVTGGLKLGQSRASLTGQISHLLSRSQSARAQLAFETQETRLEDLLKIGEAAGVPPNTSASGNLTLKAALETGAGQSSAAITITGQGQLSEARLQPPPLQQPLELSALALNFSGDSCAWMTCARAWPAAKSPAGRRSRISRNRGRASSCRLIK
jgi:uncharacterized protein involved in outer membrane biogenesis